MSTYELSGGDDGAYGPIFGPVQATEVKLISSGEQEYLLLCLSKPMQYKEDHIACVVVSPRYAGDTFAKLRHEGCTVGVGRVLPGKEADIEVHGVTTSNVAYWSIEIVHHARHNKSPKRTGKPALWLRRYRRTARRGRGCL